MKKNQGATLMELLVIVAVLIILAAISVGTYLSFQKESDLANNIEEVVQVLRLAQNKTLASEEASNFGVHLESGKYVLFKGQTYNPLAGNNETHNLSSKIEIFEINLVGGSSEVVFNRISGNTNQSGAISLRLKNDVSKTAVININTSGQITLFQESSPSDNDRIKDPRHVHFNLGWSMQNASQLKFYFPSVPQTETAEMTNYFNFDKTEFFWEGQFLVAGTNQVFQINTHSLDSFNTILSIHRDRNQGKNNQEVRIYIVDGGTDKEIAHYSSDTVEKGVYVNTMEIQ